MRIHTNHIYFSLSSSLQLLINNLIYLPLLIFLPRLECFFHSSLSNLCGMHMAYDIVILNSTKYWTSILVLFFCDVLCHMKSHITFFYSLLLSFSILFVSLYSLAYKYIFFRYSASDPCVSQNNCTTSLMLCACDYKAWRAFCRV